MKLPESWVEVSLPHISDLVGGGTPERSNSSFFGGGIHWITPSDVTKLDGLWIHSTQESLTEDGLKHSPAKVVPAGSVLMATRVAVGKAAIAGVDLATNQDFTSLVINPSLVISEYLARAIESRAGFLESRSQGSTIKGIPRSAVARFKLPLPTLLEQQRIVELLRQVEALGKCRSDTHVTIDTLTRECYAKLFGDAFSNDKTWPTRKLGLVSDIVRGSSPRPQGDPRLFGGPVPRLMVSDLTRDGLWVDATTDSLTVEGAKSSRPMPAQSVVMAVSGAPGLTAILNHDACIHDGFVGLRGLRADLLPEFVAFTLNLLRAKNDQQAVGAVFRNLTSDQVKAIPIPLPPLALQQQFQSFLFQVKSIQKGMACSTELLQKLTAAVCVDAFTGELTANWREQHLAEITAATQHRDALLRERGAKLSSSPPELTPLVTPSNETQLPARTWLLSELSDFQRRVFDAFIDYPDQPLLAEDPDVFAGFYESESLVEKLAAFPPTSPNHLRRTLSQLAALGLIAKVALPKTNPATGEQEYLTAFRPLRPGEQTRAADVATLRRSLDQAVEQSGEAAS
jgi:restriction endonuclease S subunit